MTLTPSPYQLPRIAGALYLSIAVLGGFSIGYVPMAIVVDGDAAATTANLAGNLPLFKIGIFADILVVLFELFITAILYVLFKAASPVLAATAMMSRVGMAIIMGMNLLIWVMPLTFGDDLAGQAAQVMMFFDAHALGIFVWQLFFGVHLLALGAAILRTRLAPKIFGWGLFVGAFGYLVQGIAKLMFVEGDALNVMIVGLLVIVTVAEVGFAIWLLVRGPRYMARA